MATNYTFPRNPINPKEFNAENVEFSALIPQNHGTARFHVLYPDENGKSCRLLLKTAPKNFTIGLRESNFCRDDRAPDIQLPLFMSDTDGNPTPEQEEFLDAASGLTTRLLEFLEDADEQFLDPILPKGEKAREKELKKWKAKISEFILTGDDVNPFAREKEKDGHVYKNSAWLKVLPFAQCKVDDERFSMNNREKVQEYLNRPGDVYAYVSFDTVSFSNQGIHLQPRVNRFYIKTNQPKDAFAEDPNFADKTVDDEIYGDFD